MRDNSCIRPTWVEVNLDHLEHNFNVVKSLINKNTQIMAVVKADGYGHGAIKVAEVLLKSGANQLAVATLSEAILLRKYYTEVPILILGYTPNEFATEVLKYKLSQTVFSLEQAIHFSRLALNQNTKMKIHLKIDSGMRRLGILTDTKAHETIKAIVDQKGLQIEGVYTHFAKADEMDPSFTHKQVKKFLEAIEPFKEKLGLIHVCNSAGIINFPKYHFDMVRPGIMLYGLYPSKDVSRERALLKEVMSWYTKIAQIKDLQQGEGVSYGHHFLAPHLMKIGTLPLGYADGLSRSLTSKLKVLINGVQCPIIGRICMDQCMVDISHIAVSSEDKVTIFGDSGFEHQSIDYIAELLDTINYEIVCMVGKRVPRIYFRNRDQIDVEDFNLTYAFYSKL